ncbi:Protein N-terminal and lysine N-methyltransferase efm7 [Friedmanniomyces endolithicus]|uniref:Protein N-terminal and lysine N-methyltransferase EFM7 n=1 Tax=Friedmanniomyces endolithicus TaxID=329885 RepID=A0AAN6KLC0_9PEZI|nr:Protein N-terminal and lysine N-methyltransferase efm7 [Friedmanniomyces endolithicus]KAK0864756.1 Protein N-terminal and lysine N-methyltransferase efm7 [Friedmanniomyces endolithicus]KAK0868490.1 Protein N-terminal and lysine N-methyltransferase efm7 [Friedmanniomyces endolithicus]KAK0966974.1 Protein N-terminal and lysine N-methyltransferase efm7 [Friedmanniomyces endolithicus]KAK0988663.1 Protein N-terminal and lysine N-methyltransferase efm7 [Friedmanniomyces endolithicus]
MSEAGEDDDETTAGLFKEPDDYYPPEKEPTVVEHRMLSGQNLKLRLVGHSPLWGHLLWNAGRTVADYLESNSTTLVRHKRVLELGAGAGLPSLVSVLEEASCVVVTDYLEADLIENLRVNIEQNCHEYHNIHAEGYLWGADVTPLTRYISNGGSSAGFDVLVLADLLFNHSEHGKLLATVQQTLRKSPDAQALVFFTPYRPWLLDKDLAFFDLARKGGFVVEKILEKVMEKVMFEEDPGDELLRTTVFGYSLHWSAESLK